MKKADVSFNLARYSRGEPILVSCGEIRMALRVDESEGDCRAGSLQGQSGRRSGKAADRCDPIAGDAKVALDRIVPLPPSHMVPSRTSTSNMAIPLGRR